MDEITSEPTAIAEQPGDAADQPPRPWYRRRNPLIIAAVAVVAAGVGIGIAASGGSASVTVHGSLSMGLLTYTDDAPGADDANPTPGDPCSAEASYNVAPGTTVTIGGANGQSIAVAALSASKVNSAGSCELDFSASVPDESSYTVSLGQHGTTTWTKAQATSAAGMTLSLTYTAG